MIFGKSGEINDKITAAVDSLYVKPNLLKHIEKHTCIRRSHRKYIEHCGGKMLRQSRLLNYFFFFFAF